jgi:NAD(P)-dependent dehydrogenase (short-subunit alcohol dehydrogenase family)
MFLLLQDELRQMVAQGFGGSIVNTSSVGGTLAAPGAAPYVAANTPFSALLNRQQSNTVATAFASTLSAQEQ